PAIPVPEGIPRSIPFGPAHRHGRGPGMPGAGPMHNGGWSAALRSSDGTRPVPSGNQRAPRAEGSNLVYPPGDPTAPDNFDRRLPDRTRRYFSSTDETSRCLEQPLPPPRAYPAEDAVIA